MTVTAAWIVKCKGRCKLACVPKRPWQYQYAIASLACRVGYASAPVHVFCLISIGSRCVFEAFSQWGCNLSDGWIG